MYVNNIMRDFEAAKDWNCPIHIFTNHHLGEIMHDIAKATAGSNLEPLMTRGTDMTQIDCAFTANQDEFNIIARLPLVHPE